jgi:hypothetical protein
MAYNDWLSINPTSGTGNGTVTATISSHSGYLTRSKKVRVAALINGEAKEQLIMYNQIGESKPGTPMIKADDATVTRFPISPDDLKSKRVWQFNIENTNARDFQYFVEVVEGNPTQNDLIRILSAPALTGTKITDVTTGNMVSLTTFKVTDASVPGKIKTIYSMDATNLAKKYGENQTYSVHINTTPGPYTNRSSQPVTVKYGLAVLTGATSTTPVELTSFTVSYPAVTDFAVSGGGSVSSASSTKEITITAPSDVTWNAQII